MTNAVGAKPVIPARLAERFAFAFANFVRALELTVQAAASHPRFAVKSALESLSQRALPSLKQQHFEVESAVSAWAGGDPRALIAAAHTAQTLARDLDGFDLNINRTGDEIRDKLTLVVMAAFQIASAAEAA